MKYLCRAGFATLVLISLATVSNQTWAGGPKLVGQMQTMQVAPTIKARPTTTWQDKNGKKVSLADFEGKVVLLNFWATWCPPCIRELPSLNRLQAGLGGDKFEVVALNIDRGGKPVARRMMRRLKLDKLALHLDTNSKTVKDLRVRTMPTTFIFDHLGREVAKVQGGAEWDSKEAIAVVKYFIDNPGHADKLAKRK